MAAIEQTLAVQQSTWALSHLASTQFVPDMVSVVNMSANPADIVQVSFDAGTTVAATLTPGSPQTGFSFDVTAQNAWLRRTVAGVPVTCLVVFSRRM